MARILVTSDDGSAVVVIAEVPDDEYGSLYSPQCERCRSRVAPDPFDSQDEAIAAAVIHADHHGK